MTAPVLLVVGTASSVGKSVLVAALCRSFARAGVRVAPFKAQNMSNNAYVTADGLEVGRAQAEQAAAARVDVEVDMNPVLLKPQGDRTSQIVLNGRPAGTMHSRDFLERRRDLWPDIAAALGRLRAGYDLVVAEGAGSAAEPNLYESEVVNMRVAREAGAVTLLVGDIDRGGVFGHFLGTLDLMPPADRALVRGLVINRFRGDPSLLAPAVEVVESRGGVPVVGIVPWVDDIGIAEEDAVALERRETSTAEAADIDVAVVRFPRIANFDDVDPLLREAGVRVRWVERAEELGLPHLVILPGTKATIADLRWMRSRGLDTAVVARREAGAYVLGICGGYQMLGATLEDPDGVEADAGTIEPGLGLLAARTVFEPEKETRRVRGWTLPAAWGGAGIPLDGYEIHMGRTISDETPFQEVQGHLDGSVSGDARVVGTYVHGALHNDDWRASLLAMLGRAGGGQTGGSIVQRDAAFDRLADVVEAHLDLDRIRGWLGLPSS